MAHKINWKGIPGLTADVIKELVKMPVDAAIKAFEGLSSREGSLASITADQVRAYRGTDQGAASRQAAQSPASGRARPVEETFAGRPVAQETNRGETFAGTFNPIQTRSSLDAPPAAIASEKRVSPYTLQTALKDPSGNNLTSDTISGLSDEDITERYRVYFGEVPRDAKVAREEILKLFSGSGAARNPLLD